MGTIREYKKKDGSCVYHAEVRLKGHPPQRTSHRTRSAAKKWIQDTESAIRDGRHFRTAEAKRHTLADLIDRFITQWLPRFPKRQVKQAALLSWWKNKLGHLLLADLTPAAIAEARDQLLSGTTTRKNLRSPATVNRYLASLSKALSVAVKEWGWLDDSPMRKVSKPPESNSRDRFLSIEEKQRLLETCKESSNPYLFPLVSLALCTGARQGELLSLRWKDTDFNTKTITFQITKNGKRRIIPLTPETEQIFKLCPTYGEPADELIFRSKRYGAQDSTISIRNAFAKALKTAEIEGFRFHDLRHTAASYMAMSGATQGELMAILGHGHPRMTSRYAHYSQKHIFELMQRTSQTLLQGSAEDENKREIEKRAGIIEEL